MINEFSIKDLLHHTLQFAKEKGFEVFRDFSIRERERAAFHHYRSSIRFRFISHDYTMATTGRIPESLKAIFTASNQGKEVYVPPKDRSACKVFRRNRGENTRGILAKPQYQRFQSTNFGHVSLFDTIIRPASCRRNQS